MAKIIVYIIRPILNLIYKDKFQFKLKINFVYYLIVIFKATF
jgi:hypothetical protein